MLLKVQHGSYMTLSPSKHKRQNFRPYTDVPSFIHFNLKAIVIIIHFKTDRHKTTPILILRGVPATPLITKKRTEIIFYIEFKPISGSFFTPKGMMSYVNGCVLEPPYPIQGLTKDCLVGV